MSNEYPKLAYGSMELFTPPPAVPATVAPEAVFIPAKKLDDLEARVLAFELTPESIHAVWGAVGVAEGLIKGIRNILLDRVREYIEENGEFEIDEMLYRIAKGSKSTKCPDVKGSSQKLLELFAGDLEMFLECLGSGALKPGQVRDFLKSIGKESEWENMFVVEVKETVQADPTKGSDGEAEPARVTATNMSFVRKAIKRKAFSGK